MTVAIQRFFRCFTGFTNSCFRNRDAICLHGFRFFLGFRFVQLFRRIVFFFLYFYYIQSVKYISSSRSGLVSGRSLPHMMIQNAEIVFKAKNNFIFGLQSYLGLLSKNKDAVFKRSSGILTIDHKKAKDSLNQYRFPHVQGWCKLFLTLLLLSFLL